MVTQNASNNASSSLTINGAYSLPTTAGSNGQSIQTNGSGTASWAESTGTIVQQVYTSTASVVTCSTLLPLDDTIPQNTEGSEALTLSITPKSSSNNLIIEYNFFGGGSVLSNITSALFQDSTADALFANVRTYGGFSSNKLPASNRGFFVMAAGTTSSTTIKLRVGASTGTVTLNTSTGGTRILGGVGKVELMITEVET